MNLHRVGLAAALIFAAGAADAAAQGTNLGFEVPSLDRLGLPFGWRGGGAGYQLMLDTVAYEGERSLRITGGGSGFGVIGQSFAAEPFRGSRVRLTGYVRTQDVTDGYAGLWLRVDVSGPQTVFLDNMYERGGTGTREWAPFTAEAFIPEEAEAVVFGAIMPGTGTAWFDALHIEIVPG